MPDSDSDTISIPKLGSFPTSPHRNRSQVNKSQQHQGFFSLFVFFLYFYRLQQLNESFCDDG